MKCFAINIRISLFPFRVRRSFPSSSVARHFAVLRKYLSCPPITFLPRLHDCFARISIKTKLSVMARKSPLAPRATTTSSTKAAASTTSAYTTPIITSFPLNPLTTTFVPPSDCTGISYPASPQVYMLDVQTTCLPSKAELGTTAFFSPGLICPSNYVSACSDNNGVSSITTVTCCPAQDGILLSCVPKTSSLDSFWQSFACTWQPPGTTSLLATLTVSGTTFTSSERFVSPDGLNAYGVRMVYQSTDQFPATTTKKATTTGATTTTSGNLTTSPTSSSPTGTITPTSSASPGLSTGAKTAIGVVIPVALLAILLGVFLWWRNRRRQQTTQAVEKTSFLGFLGRQNEKAGAGEVEEQTWKSELPGESVRPTELHEDPVKSHEQYAPVELHGESIPGELSSVAGEPTVSAISPGASTYQAYHTSELSEPTTPTPQGPLLGTGGEAKPGPNYHD